MSASLFITSPTVSLPLKTLEPVSLKSSSTISQSNSFSSKQDKTITRSSLVTSSLKASLPTVPKPPVAVVWFRDHDLRLHDNQSLSSACKLNGTIAPLLILPSNPSAFYLSCVVDLRKRLRSKGCGLYIRNSINEITVFCKEICATHFHYHYHHNIKNNKKEEDFVHEHLNSTVKISKFWTGYLRTPDQLPFKLNDMPEDCDEFGNLVSSVSVRKPLKEPDVIPHIIACEHVEIGKIPSSGSSKHGGETIALKCVSDYVVGKSLACVDDDAVIDTKIGRLGPFLTFGCISPRRVWYDVLNNVSEFSVRRFCAEFELVLRDFITMLTIKHGIHPT